MSAFSAFVLLETINAHRMSRGSRNRRQSEKAELSPRDGEVREVGIDLGEHREVPDVSETNER
jgi:hypothetical protein